MPMPLLIQIKGMCYEDLIIPLYRCQCTGPVSKPFLCQESHPHSGPLDVYKRQEQYSRTRQMMEQAMEDRTSFEIWEFLELAKNPVVRPIKMCIRDRSVSEYNERKDEGQVLRYLTKEEISGLASAGKVSFGVRGGNDADPEKAVENALQCFEDGIYRIFAGEEELTGLEEPVPWVNGAEGKEGNDCLLYTS